MKYTKVILFMEKGQTIQLIMKMQLSHLYQKNYGKNAKYKRKRMLEIINEIKNIYFYKNLNVLNVEEYQAVMQLERKMEMFTTIINVMIVKYQLKKLILKKNLIILLMKFKNMIQW